MYKNVIALCLVLVFGALPGMLMASPNAETVNNGGVTLFSVNDDLLGIVVHADKKIMLYQINPQNVALKAIRTWHYDAQYSEMLRTMVEEGCYPKGSRVDATASPNKLVDFFKRAGLKFNPAAKITSLGSGGKSASGGSNPTILLGTSTTQGLLVILDIENVALVVYNVGSQGITFLMCRSLIMDLQIPLFYPAVTSGTPLNVRQELVIMQRKLEKERLPNEAVPFKVTEHPFVTQELGTTIEE